MVFCFVGIGSLWYTKLTLNSDPLVSVFCAEKKGMCHHTWLLRWDLKNDCGLVGQCGWTFLLMLVT